MKRITKKVIAISIILLVLIITIISIVSMTKKHKSKEKINDVKEIYTEQNVQDIVEQDEVINVDKLMQQIDGNYVIGFVEIDKIGFEGLVYKGTSLDVLEKGVGHFENSPYFNGNVCLAAHNTSKYWAKLHTLEKGDTIKYTSFLGTKE